MEILWFSRYFADFWSIKNEQNNLKPIKIHPKSKKLSVFWLSLGVFWSFSEVSGEFYLFSGFNGVLVIWKVFGVVEVVLGAFWLFLRIFGYFGHSWCILVILAVLRGSFERFRCIYWFSDIFVILTVKINFFEKNNTLKSLDHYTCKITKIPRKQQNVQNIIPPKPLKWPK